MAGTSGNGSALSPRPFAKRAAEADAEATSARASMMEQAEQMMEQMEQGLQCQGEETAGGSPYAGALRLSREEREQRQTSNVFRVIRQQMRGNRSLYGQKLADAQRVFALMDADGSGTMTTDEFSDALTRLGLGLTAVQVAEVLAAVDADGSGTIEYDEFVALLGAEFERPASAPAGVSSRRLSRRAASASAGVARSRRVYGNRDALGFEDPPELADFRHVPVYQSCFPAYVNRVFQKAAPDLATSNRIPQETKEELLAELRPVPTDPVNSKIMPAMMHAQHAIDWPDGQIPRARPSSAASTRSAGSGRPPVGRRRPQSASSNLQRKSITMSREAKVEREVENVFRVISQQLRGKRTLYGEVMAEARDVFNLIDKDRSGTLDKTEFTTALQRMGLGLTEDQVEEVIAAVDKDGNGTIEYPEFVALLGAEWSRPRSAPPAKTRFGASQRPKSGGNRTGRASATNRSAASSRRPASAPAMDRYSAPQEYPHGWKPRPQKESKDGRSVQHVPAVGSADMSHWGWQNTPGAPGHKSWIDDYKGGVVIEQLTPRRAAWNDQIKRDPQHSGRPANLGWCRSTMTVDSIGRPQSAPARIALRQQQRALEIEASRATNAHFSRWKPRKSTPNKPRRPEMCSSQEIEPALQEIEVQTDALADFHACPAVVLQVFAAGGFPIKTAGHEVFCRVRFGKHELQTPSLPPQVPYPLPESTPLCLFGQPDQPPSENFVLVDCFARAGGEMRSIHCGSLRLNLRRSDDDSKKLRFFKFARRDEIEREPPAPTGGRLRRFKSYGFGGVDQEHMDLGKSSESNAGGWSEVFADTTGSPPPSACPEGWLALKMINTDQAGETAGKTREILEKAAQQIGQNVMKSKGTLSVTVCRGRRLPKEQYAQKLLDPICQLHYKDQTVSTSVAFNTCTPEWDETFTFDVTDLNEELCFMVYDWKADAETFDLVGGAAVGLVEELDQFQDSERWIELYGLRPDKTLRRRGDIFCRLQFSPAIAAIPRSELLVGTNCLSVSLQLECIEARGLLVKPGVKLCCIVSMYQPLHETQSETTSVSYTQPDNESDMHPEGEEMRECTVSWKDTVDLALCEPTAVVRVDVAIAAEDPRGKPKVLCGFIVPAAHLMPGHNNGEWFQLLDELELGGPAIDGPGFAEFHTATHTHAASLYFDKEQPAHRARHFDNVDWGKAQKSVGLAAIKVRSKVHVQSFERFSATSSNSLAPPGSLLDENVVGSLSVSVVRATGLPKVYGRRGFQEPDPFVKVFHGVDQHVTTTVRQSRAPCWVDGEQEQRWFTFPVSTTRSIVQFKICSKSLVGPDILLGSLSIGLREMMASASELGAELPDPADPAVQTEHKLLGVSEAERYAGQGDKRGRKKLEENGILQLAMHLQLRSADRATKMLPVTRRLRSVVLTTEFLSKNLRFEDISTDDGGSPQPRQPSRHRQMSKNVISTDGAFMCLEVNVLECTALHSMRLNGAVRPLVRMRLENPLPPLLPKVTGVDAAGTDDKLRPGHAALTPEQKRWLDTDSEVRMVTLKLQCIRRGQLARKDYQHKKTSLEISSSRLAPCEFDDRSFRLHTNNFSQQLVCTVFHDEPGKLPTLLGSLRIPIANLTLPSVTGDQWHMLVPPRTVQKEQQLHKVAMTMQAHVRGKQLYASFKRRRRAPLHVIYLLGGPGSGKTALGERLAKELDLIHLSSGEMLRRAVRQKENADIAARMRLAMEEGAAVPNEIIVPLLRRAVARLRFHRGGGTILMDGVPFTEAQRELLEELPTDELPRPVRVFHLDCDDDTMISRTIHRPRSHPPRDDNTEEVASSMAATFRKVGMTVVQHYEQRGILTKIDTGGSVTEDESYAALKRSLTKCMVDAGYWSAAGEQLTRAKFQNSLSMRSSLSVRIAHRHGETPNLPALKLRISARRAGVATATRTLIGVIRWRRKTKQSAQAAAQGSASTQLGMVAEDEPEDATVRGHAVAAPLPPMLRNSQAAAQGLASTKLGIVAEDEQEEETVRSHCPAVSEAIDGI